MCSQKQMTINIILPCLTLSILSIQINLIIGGPNLNLTVTSFSSFHTIIEPQVLPMHTLSSQYDKCIMPLFPWKWKWNMWMVASSCTTHAWVWMLNPNVVGRFYRVVIGSIVETNILSLMVLSGKQMPLTTVAVKSNGLEKKAFSLCQYLIQSLHF